MALTVQIGNYTRAVELIARRPALRLRIADRTYEVDLGPAAVAEQSGRFELVIDGRSVRGHRFVAADGVWVHLLGRSFFTKHAGKSGATQAAVSRDEVRAAMPGIVVALHVAAGDRVRVGDALLTLESMKLQLVIVAERDAVVERVVAAANVAFEQGALLLTFGRSESTP